MHGRLRATTSIGLANQIMHVGAYIQGDGTEGREEKKKIEHINGIKEPVSVK